MIASVPGVMYASRMQCDSCGHFSRGYGGPAQAMAVMVELGWTTDGNAFHCPGCPPIQEPCS